MPNGRPSIEYVARRARLGEVNDLLVSWTSSRECEALENTLVWMTFLTPPRIEIAGITPGEADPAGHRPLMSYADGLQTTVWGRGTQPDHTLNTRVEMSSNGGLIAEFGRAANKNLESCWTEAQPDLP